MIINLRFYILLLFLLLFGFRVEGSYAQNSETPPVPVIAIIDYIEVERSSKAWLSFLEQFNGVKDAYQAEIKSEQDKLQLRQDELQEQADVLSAEDFASEEKKFREAVQELRRKTDEHKKTLDNLFNEVRQEFRIQIARIVSEIAEERGINIVLDKGLRGSNLFFWANNLLITDEVLKRFNERVNEVTVGSNEASGQ